MVSSILLRISFCENSTVLFVSCSLFRFFCALAFGLAALMSAQSASSADAPVYQVGETARVDVVSTFSFVVVDPEKTEALQLKEAVRIPVIYRWNTNAARLALGNLRDTFTANRQDFAAAIESTFNRQAVAERALTNQRFRRLVSNFQSAHKGFPISSNLARAWALGENDGDHVAPFEERLQLAMARFIRPDEQPDEAKIGWQLKIVPGDATTTPSIAEIQRVRAVGRSNVIAITKLRQEFRNGFPQEQKAMGRFLAPFIRPNCFVEAALTHEMRQKQIGNLSSVNRYEPGDVIVRAGDVVTGGTKAALDEFRARLAMLRGPELVQRVPAPSLAAWWCAGGITALALTAALFFWSRARRHVGSLALVPESLGHDTVVALRNDPVIRARLLEHLTRLLGQSVVQRLFAQRGQLIDTQETATAQTAELEQRLEKVQTNVQERFRVYETRIAGLEKELAAAEEQNRDLIRAKIALAKQELEAERARNPVDWN
jgi:hypothetical protein